MTETITSPPPEKSTDFPLWLGWLLLLILLGWIAGTTLVSYWFAWFVAEAAGELGSEWPGWGWAAVTLLHGSLAAAPALPLAFLWRGRRFRAVFQTLALVGIFPFFMMPARLAPVNGHQLATVLALIGTLFFGGVIVALGRRGGGRGRPAGPYLPAFFWAPALAFGWVAWGALGSWLDTALNGLLALAFGLSAGYLLARFLLDALAATSPAGWRDYLLGGLTTGGVLTIMASAVGFNGMQIFLIGMVPAAGFAAIAAAGTGRALGRDRWLTLGLFLTLVTAAPLLYVDPDELALVLNFGTRDVFTWTFYAAAASFVVGWLQAGFGLALWRWLPGLRRGWLVGAGAGVLWLIGLLLWLLVGSPNFHGERLFVILGEQADLTAARAVTDPPARRAAVYDTLVAHADATQADLRRFLDTAGFDYTPYYLVNAMEIEGGPFLRLWLATRPEVDRVLDSPVLRPLPALPPTTSGSNSAPNSPQWNLTSIGADRVWAEFDARGQGIIVGQSDSGVQWDHPELAATYRGRAGSHDYNWLDPWNHSTVPQDIGGHGTHTLGSIVGQNVGVAPAATWYGCANLARNLANPALYLDCMQFMLAPYPLGGDPLRDGDPAQGANVINNSWGCPEIEGCDPNALIDGVRALGAAGVFVVASAGNSGHGGCGTVTDPLALYEDAFTVGAFAEGGSVADFSSRGPVEVDGSGRIKPDILAPGVGVLSSYPNSTYEYAAGTSMAGPHVVGVVALMWSANPDLIGDIETTWTILIETADPYDDNRLPIPQCGVAGTYPNNAVGWGYVDAYEAVQWSLNGGE